MRSSVASLGTHRAACMIRQSEIRSPPANGNPALDSDLDISKDFGIMLREARASWRPVILAGRMGLSSGMHEATPTPCSFWSNRSCRGRAPEMERWGAVLLSALLREALRLGDGWAK